MYQNKGGLANHHEKENFEKSGMLKKTASKDHLTHKIVTNSRISDKKKQRPGCYPANLKDEINVSLQL